MSAGFIGGKGCDLDIVPLSAFMKYAIDVKGNVYGYVTERLLSGWYRVMSPVLDLEVSCTLQIDIARIFSLQSSGRPAIDEKIASSDARDTFTYAHVTYVQVQARTLSSTHT